MSQGADEVPAVVGDDHGRSGGARDLGDVGVVDAAALDAVLHRRANEREPIAGGQIVVRQLTSLAEVSALPEPVVVNCTGLGAASLFGDPGLHPIKGQLAILLPQPEVGTEELFAWWVYEHQQPLVIPSLEEETRFPKLVEFLARHGFQSTCAVPLTTAHRRLGALGFGSKQPSAHSEEEVHILCLVADVVAVAIDDVMNLQASQRAQAEIQAKREELQRERDRLALLLNINNTLVDEAHSKAAWDALQEARRRRDAASPVEQALIDALGERYAWPPPADRAPLDAAYAQAMAGVFARFPQDADVATLYAEALMDVRPWDQWTADGQPQPGTREVLAALEAALRLNPNHPGALHLTIHALEALASAHSARASRPTSTASSNSTSSIGVS